ncbi:hypothetical protein PRIC1_014767 [Phytophthora ramorum]
MAFPLSMGFAPMSEEEQAEFMENTVDDIEEVQEQEARTQEEMIQRFKNMRAMFVRPGGFFAEQMMRGEFPSDTVQVGFSLNADTKPKSSMRSLRTLKPMTVQELDLGTTHRGRYLCGWVAIDDAFFGISSSSLLLEDVTGRLVEIAAYGLVEIDLPPTQRQRALASGFPKGKPIAVIEPYYKVRMDGSVGIRVDDAQELVPWRDVPTDLISWKKLGNEYFSALNTQNQGRGALACYQRSIEAVQPEAHTIAVLLSNLATCRFKMGDYVSSIQLSGAAAHLNPGYFKGWFRLASALAENEAKAQRGGEVCHPLVVARVVARARHVLPCLSPQEQQMLENTLKTSGDTFTTPDKLSQFHSYAQWCVILGSSEFVLVEDSLAGAEKATDAWRKEGSDNFVKGDLNAAQECYRKGLAVSAACCRDMSLVLNNIAAVHLTLFRDECDVRGDRVGGGTSKRFGDSIPRTEIALLNSMVAGIIDPLNHKAWTRRTRCLEYLGFTDEECTTDLQSIRSSVLSNTFPLTQNTQRVQEFKNIISADIQRGLQRSSNSETAQQDGNMPSSVHREKKDVCRPPSATSGQVKSDENIPPDALHGADDESIDDYIARMEGFVKRTHFAFSVAKSMSNPQLQELPREITMFFENSPPQIHIEFPKLCGWPDGIDPTFARTVLYRAYLDANVNPWIPAHTMRNGTFFESIDFSDRVKRWHGTGAMEILHSRRFVKYGDIVDGREAQKDYVPEYEARVRYNFANNPSRAEVYYFGTTHVAIGFTDFSSLLAATLHDNLHNGEPLKFVGFDMSEFAVAKCKVVAQMLKSSDVSIWSVMEVWLSSVWSGTTLKDFRKSVTALLGSLRGQNENVKVVSYLRRWASAETISSAKAHSDFFLNLERCNRKVLPLLCCFRREIDRLKLMQYMLTGEIRASSIVADLVEKERVGAANITTSVARPPEKKRNRKKKKQHAKRGSATASSSTPLVGSLTMWNVPDGSPPLEADIALNTVDFMKLLEDCKERETKQKNSTEKLSVVDLFVIHTVKNLLRLRGLMLANKLTIQVHYGVVKAVRGDPPYNHENQELLERIATMRPDTISWSNVLDYFLPKDFHDLARRCSTYGGCVHYGYSMNWSTQVFGASIIDYGVGDNKQAIDAIIDSALGFPSELMGLSLPSSVTMFKVAGLDKLLYLPFREHPLNSTGYVLAQMFNEEWIEHFMTEG